VLWQLGVCGVPQLRATSSIVRIAASTLGTTLLWQQTFSRCLAAKSRQWLDKQTRSLLPFAYYHCVFTLPAELNCVVLVDQHTAPHRVCWSSDATGSEAISESLPCCAPGDRSSTSILIFTAFLLAEH
jgi:hypothetical protein